MIFAPAFTFAVLLATLYGALTHLMIGGNFRTLSVLVLAAWLGFSLGHGAGEVLQINAIRIGEVNVFSGTLGALIALITASVFLWRNRWE